MGHEKRHRGKHQADTDLFGEAQRDKLRESLADYCWLLSKGYASPSSLKIVGDKFKLTERQRLLLMRCACTDDQLALRTRNQLKADSLTGRDLYIDGFNLLITIEAALSSGFIFIGRDGCYRDLSSVHGTYKRVVETQGALKQIGMALNELKVRRAYWLLDRPVSNSGRLATTMRKFAAEQEWNWEVELCQSPDAELKRIDEVVVSTDGVILDAAEQWFHCNKYVVDRQISEASLVDLR